MREFRHREAEFNFTTVLDFLSKYKKPILVVTALAGIAAVLFSSPYFIPPKYKSVAILFPATTTSISKVTTSTNPNDKADLLSFGEEADAEQMLQMLQSDAIARRIIEKYQLMKHYRIDPNGSYPYTKLTKEYSENVKFRRTELLSVEISVMDESPDTAAMIANDITRLLDSTKNDLQRQRAQEALDIVQRKYDEKQAYINMMVDSLQKIGELGVFNYVEQASVMSTEYAKALSSKNPTFIKEMESQRKLLGKYGPIQKAFTDRLEFEAEELTKLKSKLEQAKVDATQTLPASFVVNKAGPAERKSYPIRSLIVLISIASALGMSILICAFFENYSRYRRQKIAEKVLSERELVDA